MLRKILLRSTFCALLFSLPALAQPQAVQPLSDTLNSRLEALLQKETQRPARMNLAVDWDVLDAGNCARCGRYALKLPSHIERDTYMQVELSFRQQRPVLKGRVLRESEKNLLIAAVREIWGEPAEVSLDVFPFDAVGADYALVKTSGADLYVKPQAVAGENLATQARLGTPLKILEYSANGQLAKVRVEDDGYIAWIKRADLQEGSEDWFRDWLQHNTVLVLAEQSSPQAIPFGTRLKLIEDKGSYVVAQLPTGNKLSLPKGDLVLSPAGTVPKAEALIQTAKQYLPKAPQGGGHYLWGGTFGKRLDCSGFVQTVFRVNGAYLPRDADQQKAFTQSVGKDLNQIGELQPGDLVFFSSHGKWPTHVGMYLGEGKFIHSSSKGQYNGVKINSLKGTSTYDKFLQSIYYGGGRVVRSL